MDSRDGHGRSCRPETDDADDRIGNTVHPVSSVSVLDSALCGVFNP